MNLIRRLRHPRVSDGRFSVFSLQFLQSRLQIISELRNKVYSQEPATKIPDTFVESSALEVSCG